MQCVILYSCSQGRSYTWILMIMHRCLKLLWNWFQTIYPSWHSKWKAIFSRAFSICGNNVSVLIYLGSLLNPLTQTASTWLCWTGGYQVLRVMLLTISLDLYLLDVLTKLNTSYKYLANCRVNYVSNYKKSKCCHIVRHNVNHSSSIPEKLSIIFPQWDTTRNVYLSRISVRKKWPNSWPSGQLHSFVVIHFQNDQSFKWSIATKDNLESLTFIWAICFQFCSGKNCLHDTNAAINTRRKYYILAFVNVPSAP